MKKGIWIFVGLMIFGTLLMTGCGSSRTVEIPADNFNFLTGVWEIYVDGRMYTMEISKHHSLTVRDGGDLAAGGPVSLEGNQLVDNSLDACEARYDVTIRYEPDADMTGLHFELVGEDCEPDRIDALDGKTIFPYPSIGS